MEKKYTTKSYKETQKLGEDFARYLSSPRKRGSRVSAKILDSRLHGNDNQATVLCLEGNLGGGKTTFLQGFAKGLNIQDKILSPTFVIFKKFQISLMVKSTLSRVFSDGYFYHFDCYRVSKPEEILELGWEKIILAPKNIVAVEWPECIKKVLPKNTIAIKFKFIDQNTREISFKM